MGLKAEEAYGAVSSELKKVASGFDHATRTGDNTFSIYFKDGSKVDLAIPLPQDGERGEDGEDGVSVTDAVKYADGTMAFKLSDGTTTTPFELPTQNIGMQVLYVGESVIKPNTEFLIDENEDAFDEEDVVLATEDYVDSRTLAVAMNLLKDLKYEAKEVTLTKRNGDIVKFDVSNIITDTNIEEFKDMGVVNVLDGQALVWSASKKKWYNKSIDSSGMLVEAKAYTDEEIKKINAKGQIACDEKPTYYAGTITYVKGGETKQTDQTGIWFYYYDAEGNAVQTIWVDGTEFTIAMVGDIQLDEYVDWENGVVDSAKDLIDRSKVPNLKAVDEIVEEINDALGEKINTEDIEDSLTSDATDKPLSAKQGKELKTQIDGLIDDEADATVEDKTYSAKKIAEAIDGVNPSWNGTKEAFKQLDKSTLKDGQTVNLTDDYKSSDLLKFPSGDGFYLDEKDGVKGYNTSPTRGADTFFPFSNFKILNYVTHADGTYNDTFEVEKDGRYIVIGNANADGRATTTLTFAVDGKAPIETKREENVIAPSGTRIKNNIHQCSIYDLQKGDVIKCNTYVYGYGSVSFTVIGIE